jgi:Domain of unknown function (DUF4160)
MLGGIDKNLKPDMSPTIYRHGGYRFFFFSREEERMHVHIISADGEAKYWLEPRIELARNFRFSAAQLREIEDVIGAHSDEFKAAWQQFFSR